MTPRSLSAEHAQDSEPNLAVDPENPQHLVATAFTLDPFNGPQAPVYVSTDGGVTWSLRSIVPGGPGTLDISVGFGASGGTLYAGILNFANAHFNVLRSANPFGAAVMSVLDDRASEDQPWVSATTVPAGAGAGAGDDRVYIGHNDLSASPRTASVEASTDARTAPNPAGFATTALEHRSTAGQDGPPTRTAVHTDGTVYAAYQRWVRFLRTSPTLDVEVDVVISRDDAWAAAAQPFGDLVDPGDGQPGLRVATGRFVRFTASTGPLGQERIGADLTIAVDPNDSSRVYVAWCDRVGGAAGTDWTMHVRGSSDRGQTWSDNDLRTVQNAKNPALAVNAAGTVGLMYQQLVGTGAAARWTTQLETTDDDWTSQPTEMTLHTALASDPPRQGLPYLGDYLRLLSVDHSFYGVFSGSNLPDPANFPSGVTYQRNANWVSHALLSTDNVTPVQVSIDPFFVQYDPTR